MAYTRETAETTALRALAWLAGNDELLAVFQGASGVSEQDLRAGTGDPVFLGSVLDFILMDDAWVVACCDTLDLSHDTLMAVRVALPGGQEINWT